jgi:hypothetical protein
VEHSQSQIDLPSELESLGKRPFAPAARAAASAPFQVGGGAATLLLGTIAAPFAQSLDLGPRLRPVCAEGRALMVCFFNRYRATTVGPYNALLVFLVVASHPIEERGGPFAPQVALAREGNLLFNLGLVVDSDAAVDYGRDTLGLAKERGSFEQVVHPASTVFTWCDAAGERIVSASLATAARVRDDLASTWALVRSLGAARLMALALAQRSGVRGQIAARHPRTSALTLVETSFQFQPRVRRFGARDRLELGASTRLGSLLSGAGFEPTCIASDAGFRARMQRVA